MCSPELCVGLCVGLCVESGQCIFATYEGGETVFKFVRSDRVVVAIILPIAVWGL